MPQPARRHLSELTPVTFWPCVRYFCILGEFSCKDKTNDMDCEEVCVHFTR